MRISVAILAVLAFVAVPMATDAAIVDVSIDATSLGEGRNLTTMPFEYSSGKFATFDDAGGTSLDVIATDAGDPDGSSTFSGGREFGLSGFPSTFGSFPGLVASTWINLNLTESNPSLYEDIDEVLALTISGETDSILRIDFDDLVDNIEVDFHVFPSSGGAAVRTNFGFYAFGENEEYLGRIESNNFLAGLDDFQMLSLGGFGFAVKTLLIGAGTAVDESVAVSSIRFQFDDAPLGPVVPEPASAALALFGLAGAYFGRRRLMAAA
jgi:hypothetical protein